MVMNAEGMTIWEGYVLSSRSQLGERLRLYLGPSWSWSCCVILSCIVGIKSSKSAFFASGYGWGKLNQECNWNVRTNKIDDLARLYLFSMCVRMPIIPPNWFTDGYRSEIEVRKGWICSGVYYSPVSAFWALADMAMNVVLLSAVDEMTCWLQSQRMWNWVVLSLSVVEWRNWRCFLGFKWGKKWCLLSGVCLIVGLTHSWESWFVKRWNCCCHWKWLLSFHLSPRKQCMKAVRFLSGFSASWGYSYHQQSVQIWKR